MCALDKRSLCLSVSHGVATCAANCVSLSCVVSPVITEPSGNTNHVTPSKGFKQMPNLHWGCAVCHNISIHTRLIPPFVIYGPDLCSADCSPHTHAMCRQEDNDSHREKPLLFVLRAEWHNDSSATQQAERESMFFGAFHPHTRT